MTNTTRTQEIASNRAADEQIAASWTAYYAADDKVQAINSSINSTRKMRGYYSAEKIETKVAELEERKAPLLEVAKELRAAAVALDDSLYTGWNRFFLVQHIHSSQHCSSFRWTTRIMWLPSVSGLTEAEAVAEHGATLCTICFPSAPVELTTKPVDESICTESRDYEAPSRSGYVSGNWGTCKCGQRVTMTSAGNLRKHKK